MTATMNVSLPDPMKRWIEAQVNDGNFSNMSDYVRQLGRKEQERVAAITALQSAIDEGLNSGTPQPFDSAAFKAQMHARHDVS